MKNMNWTTLTLLAGLSCFSGCDQNANNPPAPPSVPPPRANPVYPPSTTAPDNSGVNVRDRARDAVTAGAQGQTKSDVVVTADIRKRLVDAKMSVNAQNSKIVTTNGKVTLRGPVKDQDEKDQIGKIAADVAGAENVDNQLEIAANP